MTNPNVQALAVSGTNLFAGFSSHSPGTPGGIYLSTNDGSSWTEANNGFVCMGVNALAVRGTNLFAGTSDHGIFLSTNDGTNWLAINNGLTDTTVNSLLASGTNVFAATRTGVFLTTNNGDNWSSVSSGLPTTEFLTLCFIDTTPFAGTAGSGVWRRPLTEMITAVDPGTTEWPLGFSLKQNYPHPFNPTTTIACSLAGTRGQGLGASVVRLAVYDILGREVAVLVNEKKAPGSYEVGFDASGLSTGVYFYRLTSGQYIESHKMILLK